MDLRRTDIKQQLLFSIMSTNIDTRWKQGIKRMCLNGIICSETLQVSKVKELQYS